jgi:alginate O-acetyltransferase complex protein AlgI
LQNFPTDLLKKHALQFFACFFSLCAATIALQEFLPGKMPKILPAAETFIPDFLRRKEPVAPKAVNPTAEIFTNREKGLTNFNRKLAQLKAGRINRVRVMHFGDSVIWYERVARDIRLGLQKDFGDGGRGQLLLHTDWGVTLSGYEFLSKEGLEFIDIPFEHFNHIEPKWLPAVGFSGWTYRAPSNLAAELKLSPEQYAPLTHMTLVMRPSASHKEASQKIRVTNLEKKPTESKDFDLALGKAGCTTHEIQFQGTRHLSLSFGSPNTPGEKSAFIDAALLETQRGVSYSTFVQKGKHMAWMTAITPEAFDCGYKATHPDLLVFQFGINEGASIDWKAFGYSHDYYRKQMTEFFTRIKAALPDVDILLIGPYERLKKDGAGGWMTYKSHDDVRLMQREIAQKMGFAFFDSYTFLGGEGHQRRMIKEGTATGDYAHLNDKGSAMLGGEVYRQIYDGFNGKKSANTAEANVSETDAPSPILFNSLAFVYFFIIVFAVAALLNRVPFGRLVFLTLASWYFYASWRWWALGLMLFSTGIDYWAAVKIDETDKHRRKKFWLLVSLISNLGLLFFFKYYDFFAELLNPFLAKGNFFQIPILHLVLPVGISFYTFQSLSYTIDVYRKEMPAEKSFWRFAFFVAFFPQLVAGPIVRATEFLPNLLKSIRHFLPSKDDFGSAVYLFAKGLLKKTLADWISVNYADRVFSDPGMFTSVETLVGVYAFGIQIYLDFSSYTDMAIAAARVMGFNLTLNFNRPYVSATITEFWRRWHISLSTWLRDYLYISLGGNRKRLYLNLFLTMLLGGLWHGAGVNFALWGIFHGVLLIIERATGYARQVDLSRAESRGGFRIWRPFAILITFHLVMFAWILFRCHDFVTFVAVWDSLRSLSFSAPNLDWKILTAVIVPYLWQFTAEKFHFLFHFIFSNLPAPVQAFAVYLVCLGVYQVFTAEAKAFIYFQF